MSDASAPLVGITPSSTLDSASNVASASGNRSAGGRATQRANHSSKPGGLEAFEPLRRARADAASSGSSSISRKIATVGVEGSSAASQYDVPKSRRKASSP